MTDKDREIVPVVQGAFAVDSKVEYPAFTSWWKRTIPDTAVPSSASHAFGAWMASARHRIAAEQAAAPVAGEPMTDPDINWLVHQLEAWPTRIDRDKTTNVEYLMQKAAKVIRATPASHPSETATGDALREAAEPWADYHGDLPDYDHPLRCVFESGIQYTVELLAEELKVSDWTPCDGTEEFDGDLGGTLMNIVLAALPTDEYGDPIYPQDLRAALASPAKAVDAGDGDLLAWVEEAAKASRTGISFDWVPACEGEPSGFRFMRRHFIGEPANTLRKAITLARPAIGKGAA